MPLNSTARQTLLVAAALAAGYWAHSTRTVHAAEPADLRFEFSGFTPDSALSVYSPADQSLYVYQHAVLGFGTLQCSYRFHIPKAGGPIERSNCPIGSIRP